MHLTLAFLGGLDDDQLAAAMAAVDETAVAASPFTLRIEGLGTFGPPYAPRVVWAGLGGDVRALMAVQRRLAHALEARGFPPEERPFAPHLTLARLKDRLDSDALQRLSSLVRAPSPAKAPLPVRSLAVMKSELHHTGAVYTRLRECPFGQRSG
jgi:2'-5' RNA ligase